MQLYGAKQIAWFAGRTGLISFGEVDMWWHRFDNVCPGHEDEGGRDWCAYCGSVKAFPTD